MAHCLLHISPSFGASSVVRDYGISWTSSLTFEPVHDKTYNKTCVTSKDSEQPVYLPIMAMLLIYPSLDSPETVEVPSDQQRL